MSVYRITRFASPEMDKTEAATESVRNELEKMGADFIDIVSYGNGKGVVLAKYPDQAAMDASAEKAKQVFAKMIEMGVIEADSIHPHAGVVIKSF